MSTRTTGLSFVIFVGKQLLAHRRRGHDVAHRLGQALVVLHQVGAPVLDEQERDVLVALEVIRLQ
jgi:hypothetical protein